MKDSSASSSLRLSTGERWRCFGDAGRDAERDSVTLESSRALFAWRLDGESSSKDSSRSRSSMSSSSVESCSEYRAWNWSCCSSLPCRQRYA